MRDVKELYQRAFGSTPTYIVQAPGRLELLGNHTDYNEGLVMSVAVDRSVYMAAAPRKDGLIELISSAFPDRERFYSDRIEKNPAAPWTHYVKGVLLQLRARGVHFTGFNAAIHGTIPLGAGMSSSAALEIATALTLRELFPYTVTENGVAEPPRRDSSGRLPELDHDQRMILARLCQAAESQFVGANVGLLDQISSLLGKAGHVIQIDCRHLTVEHEPMAAGFAIVVCDSGVKHNLASGHYNELRAHCESAARALGVAALRSVSMEQLEASRSRLEERDYACARHVVGENQRVVLGERALRAGEVEQFGQFLFESHASSRDWFKNSCPELDVLVDLARESPGCVGARLTGGGFGGATINLVRHHEVKAFAESVRSRYEQATGRLMEPMICQIADGARRVR